MSRGQSNWQQLKAQLSSGAGPGKAASSSSGAGTGGGGGGGGGKKRPRPGSSGGGEENEKKRRLDLNAAAAAAAAAAAVEPLAAPQRSKVDKMRHTQGRMSEEIKARYVGLDCEMVGTGTDGKTSVLARCCMVDFDGAVLYDSFVKPQSFVTDFRTEWSGVRSEDLFGRKAKNAVSFAECQNVVAAALKNKILLGHALKNDLDVLELSHPRHMIRDTARYRPYMRKHRNDKYRPRALRELAKDFLNTTIQGGEHDPSEDARTAVMLYRLKMHEWERELRDRKFGGGGGKLKGKAAAGEGGEGDGENEAEGGGGGGGGEQDQAHKAKAAAAASTSMFGSEARGLRSVSDVDALKVGGGGGGGTGGGRSWAKGVRGKSNKLQRR